MFSILANLIEEVKGLEAQENNEYLNMQCPICGKRYHLKPFAVKRFKTHYCSKQCQNEARKIYMKGEGNHQYGIRGKDNASWKNDRFETHYGYYAVRDRDHPFAHSDGTVLEHRLVAEKYLLNEDNSVKINGKMYLSPEFIVHHKNHNRKDNRPENLEIMRRDEHSAMHNKENPMPRDSKTQRFISRGSGR